MTDVPGPRRAILLTHGAGMNRDSFDTVASALIERGHRVITWDLRGHGRSTLAHGTRFRAEDALDDLFALTADLAIERPILVGHSLGGNLSQLAVRRDPDRFAGLVVVGSTPNHGALSRAEFFALRHLSAPALRLVPPSRLPTMLAAASATTAAAVERIRTVFEQMPKRTFLDVWSATAALVDPDPAYRTPVPLALIRGADDRTGNIATAMHAWARRENAPAWVIPEAGHVVMWDAPGRTAAALLAAVSAIDDAR